MATIKKYTFGTCSYSDLKPKLKQKPKILNIIIPFTEALKINLAIDECIRKLNKYKFSSTVGKRAAMNLIVHFDNNKIAIAEARLRK